MGPPGGAGLRLHDTSTGRLREINPGPAVTQFALEPGNGVKVRRITELQSDLALALAAPSMSTTAREKKERELKRTLSIRSS